MTPKERAESLYSVQKYKITDMFGNLAEGVCQFNYRGFQISATTIGLTRGDCPHPVAIFGGKEYNRKEAEVDTVEQAIGWVNNKVQGLNNG